MATLRPGEYRESIFKIDLERLRQRGIRAIMLDLDNTLVQWNHPEPPAGLVVWLERVKAAGFSVCIVSNNSGTRVSQFAGKVGIPFIAKAGKPRRKGFRAAMALLGVTPAQTAVVGDQIFTDVLGGNRAGAHTILVVPLDPREFIGTRLVRTVERLILRFLDRKGLLTDR